MRCLGHFAGSELQDSMHSWPASGFQELAVLALALPAIFPDHGLAGNIQHQRLQTCGAADV